ncbi:MAG: flagellar biosynthesis anti-sigma factor FlgM [Granulosicoccus sp.]|nr:flagellar biosynthesis anti-sigma factor FlgM [Granulosicoccus sp.]
MASSNRASPEESNVTHIDDARRKRDPQTPAAQPKAKKGANFNHEKVAAIKAAIANGTYSINPERIADKFIEQESP